MARQNTINTKFTADGRDVLSIIERIEGKLDSLASTGSRNFAANFIQSADIIIQKLQRVGQVAYEIGKRGTGFTLLQQEFEGLTESFGRSSEQIISGLQETSKNAISERNLILATNRSVLLNVADTEEELNKLLEISISRANKLGVDATQAFNDIVTGIGRESALILDNLGIIIKLEKTTEDYAQTLGKTADALTPVERKQAIVNAVFAESEKFLSENATEAELNAAKIAELSATWDNFADTFSARVAPSLAIVADNLSNVIKKAEELTVSIADSAVTDPIKDVISSIQSATQGDLSQTINKDFAAIFAFDEAAYTGLISALEMTGKESASAGELIGLLQKKLGVLEGTIPSTTQNFVQFGIEVDNTSQNLVLLNETQEEVTNANRLFEEQNRLSGSSLTSLAASTAYAADNLGIFENQLLSAQRANATFESSISSLSSNIVNSAVRIQNIAGEATAQALGVEALNRLNIEVAKLEPGLQDGEYSALDLALTFGRIEEDLLSPFKNLEEENRLAQQALQSTGTSGVQTANKIDQAFENLKGKVSGVLSSALSDDLGGIDLDSILGRQDSVSEDARRLADVAVNGFNSQWLPYLQDKFPQLFETAVDGGEIKNLAATILRDFQDGLVPELIDKETAKERVRRALIGEQNLASLASEIANELAGEFGQSIGDVQSIANNVLGVGDKLSIPSLSVSPDSLESLPKQFESSFNQSFDGMSERFATMLTEVYSAKVVLESSSSGGRQNGQSWGTGFLETVNDNVPLQLIDILTLQILPRIESALADSGNQEASR